ncbi:YkvA family protein [Hirschia baltica]|uniref:DUF1232 domain-containing protein n=1 Tax=Hirschia baltica (strain ATCC 49814 / DSM 5838 / IFAM 1418) TaxID=582402 RepID=C6XMT2_HIRBI|nr:YkvA family protein [Hirschia baltica]ACT59996.1 protein of unknown function DUF1232 [Hirschia baltica ATCC 49814]
MEILDPETEEEINQRLADERKAKRTLNKLSKYLKYIPFSEDLASAYYCAFDPKTPGRVKGVLFAALAYFVVPTDVVPDFILALGFSDDAAVIALAMSVVNGHIQPSHRQAAQEFLGIEKKQYKNSE